MATSPWGKIQTVDPVNLTDIMSEQLASDIQAKENKFYMKSLKPDVRQPDVNETPCDTDEAFAMMLQKQLDEEYDEVLKRKENKFNGRSKRSISYVKYCSSENEGLNSESDKELIDTYQLATDLQAKENKFDMASPQTDPYLAQDVNESDEVIATMLQKQFDKEYDEELKRTENKYNGSSKVSISYANYRRSESEVPDSDSDEELVDIIDRKDWDRFDNVERSLSAMPRCGYMKQNNGDMVTKHDSTLSGRKNACKFMSLPPHIHTGDGAGFDLQLSNKVFNSLKAHSRNEHARRAHKMRDKREDRATAEFGIDEFTRLLLYKLINTGLLERVNGVISTGKEALILHAESDPNYKDCSLPKECVLKVFKTTLSEFKQRDKYIRDDYRFKDRYGSKPNSHKMVTLWAEKEMHNLSRLQKAGIPCPNVLALKKHILVMSFIGENHRAAPKLKDVLLDDASLIIAYEQVVDVMKKLYTEANLIHSDLSEYNILWHDSQCWFIDVGQSVEPSHPNAHMFLFRDCSNVSTVSTILKCEILH